MSKNKFTYKDVIDLLIKKASGFYYSEEQYEYEKTQKKSNIVKNQSNFTQINSQITFFNEDKSEEELNQENKNLTLSKKKVTTHYVSPDMLAIKILLEIYGEKMNDDISHLSNNELIELKNKLIKDLQNEDN